MELNGISVDSKILEDMKVQIKNQIENITKEIYNQSGIEFNISSPKQLGEVLFEKLNLPYGKKNNVI